MNVFITYGGVGGVINFNWFKFWDCFSWFKSGLLYCTVIISLLLNNHAAKLTALSSTFQSNRDKQGYHDGFFFFFFFWWLFSRAVHCERKNTMDCSLDWRNPIMRLSNTPQNLAVHRFYNITLSCSFHQIYALTK